MNIKDFVKALDDVAKEKKIDKQEIIEAVEFGLQTIYKKDFKLGGRVVVKIDQNTWEIKVHTEMEVVDVVEDFDTQIALEELDGDYKIGDIIIEEVENEEFGRLAATKTKQLAINKIREAEKESVVAEFSALEHELVSGVLTHEDVGNYYVSLGRVHAILPKDEIIPNEKLIMGSSISLYLTKVDKSEKYPVLLGSRKSHHFVRKVMEKEITEIADGLIELYSIARDAGDRTKIAVQALSEDIDPIGACIGNRGIRIQNVINYLNGEKIEIILFDENPDLFITNALSPAKVLNVIIQDEMKKLSTAIVSDDQLSLAIGRKGQNVSLAAKLTGWKIDIKSLSQANDEGLF